MTTQEIPVTQEDREAAAAYWKVSRIGNAGTQRRYLSGEADASFIVQAFARHRHAAEAASRAREERLRSILEGVACFLQNAPLESGVCCCGDEMDNHDYHSGHSPVDQASYAAMLWVKDIRAAIAKATGNG